MYARVERSEVNCGCSPAQSLSAYLLSQGVPLNAEPSGFPGHCALECHCLYLLHAEIRGGYYVCLAFYPKDCPRSFTSNSLSSEPSPNTASQYWIKQLMHTKTLCHWKVVRNTWSLTPTIVISSALPSRNPCRSVSRCDLTLINTVLTEKSYPSMELLWVADLHGLCSFLASGFIICHLDYTAFPGF